MPLLQIVTRTCGRPKALSINKESLLKQNDRDFIQTILYDECGVGVEKANAMLSFFVPDLYAKYVWMLDDDDMCVCDNLVDTIKELAITNNFPPAMIFRGDHGELGILPPLGLLNGRPHRGKIGNFSYVVRRDVWLEHRNKFGIGTYDCDYDFIVSVYDQYYPNIVHSDLIIAKVQRISRGQKEQ